MLPKKLGSNQIKKRLIDNRTIQTQLAVPESNNISPVTFDPSGHYTDKTNLVELDSILNSVSLQL